MSTLTDKFPMQTYEQPIDVSGSQPEEWGAEALADNGAKPEENAATFSCQICYDDHPVEDLYIASMCRHKLCRDAAREVVLGAVR